jgi:hypothetical protein
LKFSCGDVPSVTVTISAGTTFTSNGTLTFLTGGADVYVNTGAISATGNISQSGSGSGGGTAVVTINGSGNQTVTGGGNAISPMPNVVINKPSGILTLSGIISVAGNWTYSGVGTGSLDASTFTSTVYFIGSPTIAGTHSLYNVTVIQNTTISSGTTLTVSGDLTISGSSALSINTGTIALAGNLTVSNAVSGGGGTGVISFILSGAQTITGNVGTTGSLCNLQFNKGLLSAGGSITLVNTIPVAGSITFNGNGNTSALYSINGSGTLQANSDVILGSGANVNGGSGIINIVGSTATALIGNSSGVGKLPKVTINKTNTLTLSNTIGAANDWTFAGGTLSPGTSTLIFYDNLTIGGTAANHNLNNVTLTNSAGSTITVNTTTLNVAGILKTAGSNPLTVNASNLGVLNLTGTTFSLTNTNSGGGGSGTINLSGNGAQAIIANNGTTGKVCNITVNKSGGSIALTYTSTVTSITLSGSAFYTINDGTSGNLQTDGSLVLGSGSTVHGGTGLITLIGSANPQALTGNSSNAGSLPNLTINKSGGNIGLTYTTSVSGTLTFAGTAYYSINNTSSGELCALGDAVVSSPSSYLNSGTGTVAFRGGATTLTGNGGGSGTLPNVIIAKSGGATLSIAQNLRICGDFLFSSGTINPNTGNITFMALLNTGHTITSIPTLTLYSFAISNNNSGTYTSGTITLAGNVTANSVTIVAGRGRFLAGANLITMNGNWTDDNLFTCNTSTVTFTGSATQTISGAASLETFNKLIINKTAGTNVVNFSLPIQINTELTLSNGVLKTTNTSLLTIINGATSSLGADNSYVDAPVKKVGNTSFTYPLGSNSLSSNYYHPLNISPAPINATDAFTAQYFPTNQTQTNALSDSLESISTCEYWTLTRNVGSSNVLVQLGWNGTSCSGMYPYSGEFVIAYTNLSITDWESIGGNNSNVLPTTTNIQSLLNVPFSTTNPTYLTLGKSYGNYGVLKKQMDGGYFSTKNGVLRFKYDEDYNDLDALLGFKIYDKTHKVVFSNSAFPSGQAATLGPCAYGDNRYSLNFNNLFTSGMLFGDYYVLEVTNEKNDKFYLRFMFN